MTNFAVTSYEHTMMVQRQCITLYTCHYFSAHAMIELLKADCRNAKAADFVCDDL